MKDYKSLIDPLRIPAHVAIIMDGNGRWAEKRSLPRLEGHRRGAEVVETLMDSALALGIKVVSLYAFSTENWSRPRAEVSGLWKLLERFFEAKIGLIEKKNIRIRFSGDFRNLPSSTVEVIRDALSRTKKNRRLLLNFCLNYGGRQEIVDAVNRWLEQRKPRETFTMGKMGKNLYTAGLPDVDVMIRTSGEYRISNFLLWQMAYAEFVFMKVLWPDFRPAHLFQAVYEYQKRERRFGGI